MHSLYRWWLLWYGTGVQHCHAYLSKPPEDTSLYYFKHVLALAGHVQA